MSTSSFVHLHLHTEYSLQDSVIRIPEKPDLADPAIATQANLLSRAVELGLAAVAVTDVNNLFALIKFYQAACHVGIKPIIGADLLVATPGYPLWPMTVLCRDQTGYLNLSRLITRMWLEGHRADGTVAADPAWIGEHRHHLCALLGLHSLPAHLAKQGKLEEAEEAIASWRNLFDDDVHLEISRTTRAGEEAFNTFALHTAAKLSLPLIATNDVRFLTAEDYPAHEARVCIASGRTLSDPKRPRDYRREQYLRSGQEMASLFADVPDALSNTLALATRCNFELRLGTYHLPAYPVPPTETLDSWICNQARAGLQQRLEHAGHGYTMTPEKYISRLEYELEIIIKMGFSGYFLIVADFIQWGKNQGIPIGPGRGSGAGSLVAWALQITDLDPLPYNLLFERFLNPERVSMPDFDIDFCMDRRDEVIDYVARKYGRDRVSQIITYGTMAAKAVVRDTGRVLGLPYGLVDGVAKLIPNVLGITLKKAMGESSDPEAASADLIQRYQTDDDVRELIDLARQLENLTRNAGKHAGGVVIAPQPLSEFCPLFAEPDEGGRGIHPVTQFDKNDVEAIGLVKFDFLGLRTLTIIDWTVHAINARLKLDGRPALDMTTLALDDQATYQQVFASGKTGAVFQFESAGMRRLLKDAKPDRFEDLIALVSLYRPGPMDLIPSFVKRKHGQESVSYPDPRVQPILQDTYGIMVYQEQVMQMAQIVGGYSLGAADLLRRAMGKKVPAEMAKHREVFRTGAQKGGVDGAKADEIFDLMEKFAGYGFNKSHAAAYALVSYQTAWLKQHYPSEFMAATLSSDMDNTEKVVGFLDEVRQLGLTLLPPHINHSSYAFEAIDAQTIRYGLGAIKGVGEAICHAIKSEYQRSGPFSSLLDLCVRVDSIKRNRRTLEALIYAGAADGLAPNRGSLITQVPDALKASDQLAQEQAAGQSPLFAMADQPTPMALYALPVCSDLPRSQRLERERETLGLSLSGHRFDPYRSSVRSLVDCHLDAIDTIFQADESADRLKGKSGSGKRTWRSEKTVTIAGTLAALRRKGDQQLFFQLEDGLGRVECSAFSDLLQDPAINALFEPDRLLIIKGGLREDEFNGGYTVRLRQCWDFDQLCQQHASTLNLDLDLRSADAWPRLAGLLSLTPTAQTSLRLRLIVEGSAGPIRGLLTCGDHDRLCLTLPLIEQLEQDEAVIAMKIQFDPTWKAQVSTIEPNPGATIN